MILLLQTATALVYYEEKYIEEKVRDCQRTPMQWTGDAPYVGFTSWLEETIYLIVMRKN